MTTERQISPSQAWDEMQARGTPILDLRTAAERRRYGAPPGSTPVPVLRHAVRPDRDAIYLCQHAVRSKLPARRGAREIAGGFAAWKHAGLPVEWDA
jgi:rhodanese-related sulfurtransferase